jgi:ferredoxin
MKAKVDKEICIGCELCVQTCPEVFVMDPDGKARARAVSAEHEASCKDAADQCPVTAILID